MMNVNKAILIGNLTANPDMKYTQNGNTVCNIRMATNEKWTNKNTGEKEERTAWHRVVIFNRLAEIAGNILQKGSKVYIEGKIQTRKWIDQHGIERHSTEIIVDNNGVMINLAQPGNSL